MNEKEPTASQVQPTDRGYTPGPWEWNDCDGFLIGIPAVRGWPKEIEWPRWIGNVDCFWWARERWLARLDWAGIDYDARRAMEEELVANAKLMAAAPDMYEALRAVMDANGPLTDEQLRKCHQAMTKAETGRVAHTAQYDWAPNSVDPVPPGALEARLAKMKDDLSPLPSWHPREVGPKGE
jgi:hypothetical protein